MPGDPLSHLMMRGIGAESAPAVPGTGTRLPDPGSQPKPGDLVGEWHLQEVLGQGAFGTVFRATRPVSPGSERTHEAAVKVLTREERSGAVVERFAAERALLARLSHPGIAQLIDTGHTASGTPWVAMALVRGEPIDIACDRASAGLRMRVQVLALVCDAVAAAHRLGIVHRDLKPGNILVDWSDARHPRPVVIDFGVAKSLDTGEQQAFATRDGSLVGTVEFISPEAAALGSSLVDTRADVYSLGVIASLVLGGGMPIDIPKGEAVGDMLRRVREEPPRRLSSVAQRAGKRPEWVGALSGGLEWVVHRALEKDPDRRYESAAALAEDLRRWLEQRPVEAAPPSAIYPLVMWARRNRGVAAGAAVAVAGLVAAAAWASWVAHERGVAAESVRQALVREESVRRETQDRYTRFRKQLAPVLTRFGFGERTGDSLEMTAALLDVHEEVFGPEAPETSSLRRRYANALRRIGRPSEALPHHWALMDLAERSLGPTHRSTLLVKADLAQTMRDLDMGDEIVALLEPVVAVHDAAGPASDANQYARGLLASGYLIRGDLDLAKATLREAISRIADGPRAGTVDEAIIRGYLADLTRRHDPEGAALVYMEISAPGRYQIGDSLSDRAWRAAWRGEWVAWRLGGAVDDHAERECLRAELADCLAELHRDGNPANERLERFARLLGGS